MSGLTVGSLFSGIGGLELGLERAGMRTVWQVEQSDFCRAVLTKHWPDVPKYTDVRDVGKHNLAPVDLICGGFPCQDVSTAGKRAGIAEGTRSGLWYEFARIIGELRPGYVVVENVTGLLTDGLGRVLGELARLRYDAEWSVLPACAVGAPHTRERVFVLAYPDCGNVARHGRPKQDRRARYEGRLPNGGYKGGRNQTPRMGAAVWPTEPAIPRVVDGVPSFVDRVSTLGNAVVPQVAEFIGRLIVEADAASLPSSRGAA